ncbi:hypothetical protein Tco_1503243 [Tanacetum coccineum]
MANEAKRYLDKSSEGLGEIFPGEAGEVKPEYSQEPNNKQVPDLKEEIIVKRDDNKTHIFSEADYKYLNKDNTEDMYYLEKVLKEVSVILCSERYKLKDLPLGELDKDIMELFEKEIKKRLKHQRQMRKWESVVNGRSIIPCRFKLTKQVHQPVSKKNGASSSAKKKQPKTMRQEGSTSNPFEIINMVKNDDDLGSNEGSSNLGKKGDSPSSKVMPLTYSEHSPKEKPGLGTIKHTTPDIQDSSSKSLSGPVTVKSTKPVTT